MPCRRTLPYRRVPWSGVPLYIYGRRKERSMYYGDMLYFRWLCPPYMSGHSASGQWNGNDVMGKFLRKVLRKVSRYIGTILVNLLSCVLLYYLKRYKNWGSHSVDIIWFEMIGINLKWTDFIWFQNWSVLDSSRDRDRQPVTPWRHVMLLLLLLLFIPIPSDRQILFGGIDCRFAVSSTHLGGGDSRRMANTR